MSAPSVALVTMPFSPGTRPSLQLGILKSVLARDGIPARCFYFNVEFYHRMRKRRYHTQYTSQVPSLVYEWYFSERPFTAGPVGPDWEACNRLQAYARQVGFPWESMLDIKTSLVPEFLDWAMEHDWSGFDVVGFTMTYPQITASLALARRIKERHPHVRILFGGAGSQIHGESAGELLRCFPFLDAAVIGEGEPVVAPLVRRLAAGEDLADLPGVMYRVQAPPGGQGSGDEVLKSQRPSLKHDLDDPYFPDFQEYFEKIDSLEPATRVMMERVLPMEMGRGCAWGDNLTCTFCAFTFHGTFRRRSKDRILAEIDHQVARYGLCNFYLVDDLITTQMIQEVFPELRARHPRLRIPFMEMRTACTEKHLDLLAQAGVQMVQPGIESMDDGLLQRMSKGTTVFHNLMFMKGARERGIRLSYNIILGFPGTTPQELEAQYRHLRMIPHLDPGYTVELSLVRFSPYYHDPAKFGMSDWKPVPFYKAIYPDGLDISKVAYEYSADFPTDGLSRLYRATVEYLGEWQRMWGRSETPYLWYEEESDGLVVVRDGRLPSQEPVEFRLDRVESDVYRSIMRKPLSAERLAEAVQADPSAIQRALDRFVDEALVVEMRGKYLALALDRARVEGRRLAGVS